MRYLFIILILSNMYSLSAQTKTGIVFKKNCIKFESSFVKFQKNYYFYSINIGKSILITHNLKFTFSACDSSELMLRNYLWNSSVCLEDTVFSSYKDFEDYCISFKTQGIFIMAENSVGEFVDFYYFKRNFESPVFNVFDFLNKNIAKSNEPFLTHHLAENSLFRMYALPHSFNMISCSGKMFKIRQSDTKIRFHYFFLSGDYFKEHGYNENIHIISNWVDIPD